MWHGWYGSRCDGWYHGHRYLLRIKLDGHWIWYSLFKLFLSFIHSQFLLGYRCEGNINCLLLLLSGLASWRSQLSLFCLTACSIRIEVFLIILSLFFIRNLYGILGWSCFWPFLLFECTAWIMPMILELRTHAAYLLILIFINIIVHALSIFFLFLQYCTLSLPLAIVFTIHKVL